MTDLHDIAAEKKKLVRHNQRINACITALITVSFTAMILCMFRYFDTLQSDWFYLAVCAIMLAVIGVSLGIYSMTAAERNFYATVTNMAEENIRTLTEAYLNTDTESKERE